MTTQPRHRWFSFSLRSLLVLVVVLAVPLGWVAKERRQSDWELSFIAELRKDSFRGATIQGPYATWEMWMTEEPWPWWNHRVTQLLGKRILLADHPHPGFTDLKKLDGLTNLQMLELSGSRVTDLTPLHMHPKLKVLFLDDTEIADLSPLAKLKNLKYVDLRGTPVTDLSPLLQLNHLEGIVVAETDISAEQLSAFKTALPNCTVFAD